MRIGIDAYYRRVRYILRERADREGGKEEREATIISNIKIIIIIAIYIPPLITLYYI